jgi:hypothetical protein
MLPQGGAPSYALLASGLLFLFLAGFQAEMQLFVELPSSFSHFQGPFATLLLRVFPGLWAGGLQHSQHRSGWRGASIAVQF